MTFSEAHGRRRSSTDDHRSVVWFISFGDLLTLLLCFFLVLTPWDRLVEAGKTEINQQFEENTVRGSASGTAFASKPRRVSKIVAEVPVFETSNRQIDLAGVRELLPEQSKERGDVAVLLRVCGSHTNRQQLVEQLGTLVQERIGVTETLSFEVLAHCDSAEILAPVTGQVVGVVRVTRV